MKKFNMKKHMMAAAAAAMAFTTVIGYSVTAAAAPGSAVKIISMEQAKEAALKAMNIKKSDAVFTEQECELDDGVYELEFTSGRIEYDAEVNAYTGKVTQADYENNRDWDKLRDDCFDNDRDNGWDDDRFDDIDDDDDDDRFDDDDDDDRFDDIDDDDDRFDDDDDDDRFDD